MRWFLVPMIAAAILCSCQRESKTGIRSGADRAAAVQQAVCANDSDSNAATREQVSGLQAEVAKLSRQLEQQRELLTRLSEKSETCSFFKSFALAADFLKDCPCAPKPGDNLVHKASEPARQETVEQGAVVEPGDGDTAIDPLKSRMKRIEELFELSVRSVGPNEFQVMSSGLRHLTPEMMTYSGTRIVPNYRGGTHAGFKLVNIKPGGIFATLGFQSGDIALEMGGMPLSSPTALVDALQLLFDGQPQKVTFTVSRGGNPVKLTYTIVNDAPDDGEAKEDKGKTPVVIQSGD